MRLVLFANCSLRSASAVMRELSAIYRVKTPSHTTIQNWILKCGVVCLADEVKKRRNWIFILDYTVEYGTKKCLLILGVPRSRMREGYCSLKHEDVEVLAIHLTDKTSSAGVKAVLEKTAERVGVPIQIVSDHGSDIKKGIEDYIKSMPIPIVFTYDITHKTGIILKRILKDDIPWQEFIRNCVETKRLVLYTDLGHLAPPKPSDKARWLNLDTHVEWADAVSRHAKRQSLWHADTPEAVRFRNFFGWLKNYAPSLARWRLVLEVLRAAKAEVKINGLHRSTSEAFMKRVAHINGAASVPEVVDELRSFLERATTTLPKGRPWLGTSDIIESIFGKYKSLSQRVSMKGVGKTVLTIPVFTDKLSAKQIKEAMEKVTCKKVAQWINLQLGVSLFAKRKKALGKTSKPQNSVKSFREKYRKVVNF